MCPKGIPTNPIKKRNRGRPSQLYNTEKPHNKVWEINYKKLNVFNLQIRKQLEDTIQEVPNNNISITNLDWDCLTYTQLADITEWLGKLVENGTKVIAHCKEHERILLHDFPYMNISIMVHSNNVPTILYDDDGEK